MATDLTQEFCALRDTYIEKQFGRLNEMQRRAVFTTDGPLLILAGAGSGKTTVLVNRIANIMRFGSAHGSTELPRPVTEADLNDLRNAVSAGRDLPRETAYLAVRPARPWNVLAITFTNKAAGELKERLRAMLGDTLGGDVNASTFHSACVRMLRRDAERIIGDARRTADEVMRELDALRKMEKTDTDHHRANDARAALRRKLNAAEDAAAAAAHPQIQEKKVSARPVRVGDTVQLRKMGDIKATVTAVSADRTLSLRAGIMNVTAKEQDVYLLENEKPEAEKFAAAHAASLRSVAAESEIDLRGMDSMEAVAATERFLDNAVMAKLEKVTIIHGKGTGALRAAVQQSLRRNKAVKSFRLGRYGEGESGVTVVELK